jgi:hypothetical protein
VTVFNIPTAGYRSATTAARSLTVRSIKFTRSSKARSPTTKPAGPDIRDDPRQQLRRGPEGVGHRTHDADCRDGVPRESLRCNDGECALLGRPLGRHQGRPNRHNAIGHIEGGASVRDDDARDRKPPNSVVDRPLVLLVEMAGGFVEQ